MHERYHERRAWENIDAADQQAATMSTARDIGSAGYRWLALQYHPDRGGDHATMVRLKCARDLLTTMLRQLPGR